MAGHGSFGRFAPRRVRAAVDLVRVGRFFAGLTLAGAVGLSLAAFANSTTRPACDAEQGVYGLAGISAGDLRKRAPGRFLIVAHRGYSSAYEENSLDAFEEAIAAGADLIETDVRRSSDNVIVLSHAEAEEDTARALAEEGVIRFEPLLRLAKGRIVLLLDMKDEDPSIFAAILDMIKRHGMEDQVVFGLRSVEQTRAFRKLNSRIVVLGFLSPSSYDFSGFFEAGGDIARLWEGDIDASLVKEARGDTGTRPIWITPRVRPDPVGDIDDARLRKLMDDGYEGVLANDPESAVAFRCAYFHERRER